MTASNVLFTHVKSALPTTGPTTLWPTLTQHAHATHRTRTIPPWLRTRKWKGNPREANTDEGAYTQPQAGRNEETKDPESARRIFHDNNKLTEFTSHILFILFDRVAGSLQHIGGKFWRAVMRPYENPGWCEATRDSWWPIFTGDMMTIYDRIRILKLRRP